MRLVALALVLAGAAGCSGFSLPANPTQMDASQIKEWVKDKTANVGCGFSSNPYGKFNMVYLNLDTGVIPHGTVTIDEQCKVTITNPPPMPRVTAPTSGVLVLPNYLEPGASPIVIPSDALRSDPPRSRADRRHQAEPPNHDPHR